MIITDQIVSEMTLAGHVVHFLMCDKHMILVIASSIAQCLLFACGSLVGRVLDLFSFF